MFIQYWVKFSRAFWGARSRERKGWSMGLIRHLVNMIAGVAIGRANMRKIAELVAVVAAQTSVIASVRTLLDGYHARLQAAVDSGDSEELQKAIDQLKANTGVLSAAVAENTIAAPISPIPVAEPAPNTIADAVPTPASEVAESVPATVTEPIPDAVPPTEPTPGQ